MDLITLILLPTLGQEQDLRNPRLLIAFQEIWIQHVVQSQFMGILNELYRLFELFFHSQLVPLFMQILALSLNYYALAD